MTTIHRTRLAAEGLDAASRAAYERDGVLVIEDFVDAAACEALRARALALVERHAPEAPGTVFSTHDQRHDRDAYFERSANGIGVFFEDGAFDAAGRLQVPLAHAVNKLGHAMHDLDPVFDAFSHGPRLQAVADGIGLAEPRLLQSMYIFKPPGLGGEVTCHQDSTFLHTEPMSVVGFWFAIEDAHRGNGCLGGMPGEHCKGLRQVYRRRSEGGFALETVGDPQWDESRFEWIEAPRGTLVVFDGAFPHRSEANRSNRSRHACTLHAVSGRADYPASNWIQRRPGIDPPLRGFV